ncbi:hyaluronidase-like [Corticium candelabrum]|uniref:hyaluronidase-like n=1 Tax=Corticium candelabrum TaxID=121492 RepID=UPI002E26E07A|nr:hyaluronidase-like [Corticium candelabrum]
MERPLFVCFALGLSLSAPFSDTYAYAIRISPHVLGPSLPNRPFLPIWFGKSSQCSQRCDVNLSLSSYGIVHNANETWWGEVITTMGKIGLYPFYDRKSGTPFRSYNGGIPQLGNLSAHLEQVKIDIRDTIPDGNFRGLGFIDWEEWKPVWERNWDSRKIYVDKSIELVQQQHPDWTQQEVANEAKQQFESSARLWMETTLKLVTSLRPNATWGYYEFPDCFNDKGYDDYHCSSTTVQRNNEIQWLFNSSTVLYPSIYVYERSANYSLKFKFNMLEALRVDGKRDIVAPIYPFAKFEYGDLSGYVTHADLVETVGQAADLGMSGIVFWGDANEDKSCELCVKLQQYVKTTLGPYVLNVSQQAEECSLHYCSGNGRCYIQSDHYFSIIDKLGITSFLGSTWNEYPNQFECQCYLGWSGSRCGTKSHIPSYK